MAVKRRAMSALPRRTMKKRRMPMRKRRANMVRAARRTMMAVVETKRQIWDPATDVSMTVGSLYAMNPLYQNAQGTADGQHVGNEIYLRGLGMKGIFVTPEAVTTAPWFFFVALVKSRQQLSDLGEQNFNSTTTTNFVRNVGHPTNWIFDTDKCQVIRVRKFKAVPQLTSVWNNTLGVTQNVNMTAIVPFKVYIPFRDLKFQYDNVTGFGKFTNYYWLIWAASNYGVTGTSKITATAMTYYKDP